MPILVSFVFILCARDTFDLWMLTLLLLLPPSFADDPLVTNIAQEYMHNREKHDQTAREWVQKYAT